MDIFVEPLVSTLAKSLESTPNLAAMVQKSVRNSRCIQRKEHGVIVEVAGTEIGWRIGFELGSVKHTAVVDNTGDVVVPAEAVEDALRVDGKVRRVECVFVPHGDDAKEREKHADEPVDGVEKGNDQRRCIVEGEDVPVESGKWVEAEPVAHPRDSVKIDVRGCDPSGPIENAECCEEVVGEKEVANKISLSAGSRGLRMHTRTCPQKLS